MTLFITVGKRQKTLRFVSDPRRIQAGAILGKNVGVRAPRIRHEQLRLQQPLAN